MHIYGQFSLYILALFLKKHVPSRNHIHEKNNCWTWHWGANFMDPNAKPPIPWHQYCIHNLSTPIIYRHISRNSSWRYKTFLEILWSLFLFWFPMHTQDIENHQYLVEDVRTLPKVTTLHLIVMSIGHSYGASLFHILRVCTGVRKLVLELPAAPEVKLCFFI